MKGIKVSAIILGLLFLQPVFATPEVHVDGFLSVGAGILDANQVYARQVNLATIYTRAALGEAPDFVVVPVSPEINAYNGKAEFQQDSIVTLQSSMDFNQQYALTAQVSSKGSNRWDLNTEWAFLSYRLTDSWCFKVGRMRTPLFMLSESLEVGYTYPWVRPPLEVYSIVPSNNYSGVSVSHRGVLWNQDYEIGYRYGSVANKYVPAGLPEAVPQVLRQRQSTGVDISYGNEGLKTKLSYTEASISLVPQSATTQLLEAYSVFNPDAYSDADVTDVKAFFGSVGVTLDRGNWLAMVEWVKRGSNIAAIPVQKSYYATLGYRFGNVMPHFTYANLKTTDKARRVFSGAFGDRVNEIISMFNRDQESYIVGIRYDFISGMDFKIQAENIKALHGTNGLFNVNPQRPVTLYSAVIDIVF